MFHSVLVPVDFTERSAVAADLAAELVDAEAGKVTLIHVVQTVPGIEASDEDDFYRRLEAAAADKMSDLAERLASKDVCWRAVLLVGSRAGEILRAAEGDIDLIVLSSHRVDSQGGGAGAGTLSYQIAVAAPCPVLLVK